MHSHQNSFFYSIQFPAFRRLENVMKKVSKLNLKKERDRGRALVRHTLGM